MIKIAKRILLLPYLILSIQGCLGKHDGSSSLQAASPQKNLAAYSQCMSYENWQAAGMERWQNKVSDQGWCVACHANGAGSFLLGNDDRLNFKAAQGLSLTRWFKLTPGLSLEPNDELMASISQNGFHPSFQYSKGDLYNQSLKRFASLTEQCLAEGLRSELSQDCDGPECGGCPEDLPQCQDDSLDYGELENPKLPPDMSSIR